MKRTKPVAGIHHGMSFEAYLAIDAINHSALEHAVIESLEHFIHYWTAEPEPSTPDQAFGQLMHKAFLEPEELSRKIVHGPINMDKNPKTGQPRNTPYGRDTVAWANAQADQPDKILATQEEIDTLNAIAAKAAAHPTISAYFSKKAGREVVAVWECPVSGLMRKARADIFVPGVVLVDLKSTRSAHKRRFYWDALKYGYFRQAADYIEGFAIASKTDPAPFFFVPFEKEKPYGMAVFRAVEDELQIARDENTDALIRIAKAQETGEFPSYPTQVQDLERPGASAPYVESVS